MSKLRKIILLVVLSMFLYNIKNNIVNARQVEGDQGAGSIRNPIGFTCYYSMNNMAENTELGSNYFSIGFKNNDVYVNAFLRSSNTKNKRINMILEEDVLNHQYFKMDKNYNISTIKLWLRACVSKTNEVTADGKTWKENYYNAIFLDNRAFGFSNYGSALSPCGDKSSIYELKLEYCGPDISDISDSEIADKYSKEYNEWLFGYHQEAEKEKEEIVEKKTTTCTYEFANDSSDKLKNYQYNILIKPTEIITSDPVLKSNELEKVKDVYSVSKTKNKFSINDFSVSNKTKCPEKMYLNYCYYQEVAGVFVYHNKVTSIDTLKLLFSRCYESTQYEELKLVKKTNEGVTVDPSNYKEVSTIVKDKLDKDKDKDKDDYKVKVVSCGSLDNIPASIPRITRNIYNVIKVLVPIILIVLGMYDFFRAMTSNDESKMNQCKSAFVRRLIAGVLILLTMSLVQFVFNLIPDDDGTSNDLASCISCFINSEKSCGSEKFYE